MVDTARRAVAELGSVIRDPKQVRRALTSARRRGIDLGVLRRSAERLHRPHQAGTGMMLRLLNSVPSEGTLPATWFEELRWYATKRPADVLRVVKEVVKIRQHELRDLAAPPMCTGPTLVSGGYRHPYAQLTKASRSSPSAGL